MGICASKNWNLRRQRSGTLIFFVDINEHILWVTCCQDANAVMSFSVETEVAILLAADVCVPSIAHIIPGVWNSLRTFDLTYTYSSASIQHRPLDADSGLPSAESCNTLMLYPVGFWSFPCPKKLSWNVMLLFRKIVFEILHIILGIQIKIGLNVQFL